MKASDRVIVNTGILYARMAITVFLSLYTTRVILSALGAEDFGIFNVVAGTITMLTFLNTTMTATSQRFMSVAQGKKDERQLLGIFNVSFVLHAVIGVIVFFILEGAGGVLFDGILQLPADRILAGRVVFQFAIATTLISIISTPYDAVISAREHMLLFAFLGIVEAVLKLAVAVAVDGAEGDRLMFYASFTTVVSGVIFAIKAIYCHCAYRECKFALRSSTSKAIFKEMTSFSGWYFLGASTSIVSFYGQGIVLNNFFGPAVNGAQGVATQVSGQLGAFASAMMRALSPLIARSEGAGERELMLKAAIVGSKLSFFLLMLLYVPVFIEMPFVFKLWLKDVPEFTVVFCRLLLIRNLVEQFYLPIIASINAVGDIKNFQISMSILNIFPLIISYFLFNFGFGPELMYLIYLAYSLCLLAITLFFAKMKCGMNIRLFFQNVVLRCVFILGAIAFLTAYFGGMLQEGLTRLFFDLVFSTILFCGLVWHVGLMADERAVFLSFVNRFFGKKV